MKKQFEILNIINNIIYSLRRNSSFSLDNCFIHSKQVQEYPLLLPKNSEILKEMKFRLKEEDLLRNFTILRFKLQDITVATHEVLWPFLEILQSGITTGHVTLLAIQGISFILKEFDLGSVNLPLLTSAVTKCKFEASEAINDEIVLANILGLLKKIVINFKQDLKLTEIMDILQVSLGMYFQNRISEFLKKEALHTLSTVVVEISFLPKVLFEILKVISGLLDQDIKGNIDSVHRNLGLYLLQVVLDERGTELNKLMGLVDHHLISESISRKNSFILTGTTYNLF
jgi:hypothetical protein